MSFSSTKGKGRALPRAQSSRTLRPTLSSSTSGGGEAAGFSNRSPTTNRRVVTRSQSSSSLMSSNRRASLLRARSFKSSPHNKQKQRQDKKPDDVWNHKMVRWGVQAAKANTENNEKKFLLQQQIDNLVSSTREKELDVTSLELEIRVLKEHVRVRSRLATSASTN